MRVLILTVNFKNYIITKSFIDNLSKFNEDKIDITIIDNESNAIKYSELETMKMNSVQLFRTDSNLGYFGAVRYALNIIKKNLNEFDIVIISNNDIEINDLDFFYKLKTLKINNTTGCIAPKITIKNTNINQNPFMYFEPSIKYIAFNKFFLSNYYLMLIRTTLAKIKSKLKRSKRAIKTGQKIFAPHGAFIILTKEYFNRGGFIDDGFFLYGEELSIGYQCKKMGLDIVYNDDLNVIHNEHQTTSSRYTRFKYKAQKEAFTYIMNHYKDGSQQSANKK